MEQIQNVNFRILDGVTENILSYGTKSNLNRQVITVSFDKERQPFILQAINNSIRRALLKISYNNTLYYIVIPSHSTCNLRTFKENGRELVFYGTPQSAGGQYDSMQTSFSMDVYFEKNMGGFQSALSDDDDYEEDSRSLFRKCIRRKSPSVKASTANTSSSSSSSDRYEDGLTTDCSSGCVAGRMGTGYFTKEKFKTIASFDKDESSKLHVVIKCYYSPSSVGLTC
nr:hypothetical protein [Oryctes rhinoceros nudivirus]WDA64752.1 hypothetical protein NALGGIOA_00059 [Oryctes rhinoceros nudivirus]